MIPKIIHYCWFGGNPKPKLAKKCIASWRRCCPDYEIIEWNESRFSIADAPLYVRQAYELKKWAFVTDYVRLQVVYENGGLYFDTDVELLRPIEEFMLHHAFFGFEDGVYINTGLGFGAEKGTELLLQIMEDYQHIPYIRPDGTCDDTPCPRRNTAAFLRAGLKQKDELQLLDGDTLILPSEYLSPKNWKTGQVNVTEKTYSIHHCGASWYTPKMLRQLKRRQMRERMSHLPSAIGARLLGRENYEKLRSKLKN